jgi:hypothetical protein
LHVGDGVIGVPAVVVIVVDGGVIDRRVRVVHPIEIASARVITRNVRIARPKWKPTYRRGIPEGEAHAEATTASATADPPY